MTRWVAGTSVETEWEGWVRETAAGELNVGLPGGGWFIHRVTSSLCVKVMALCVAEREIRPFFYALFHNIFAIQHRCEDWANKQLCLLSQMCIASYQNIFLLPLLSHLSYPTATTAVFLLPTTVSPTTFFLKKYQSMTQLCFESNSTCALWLRNAHWQTVVAGHSKLETELHHPWRGLSRVEMDGLMDRWGGGVGVFPLCWSAFV